MNILILCNGRPPSEALFKKCLHESDLLIAADGGANNAFELGGLPDVIIGDMDSYRPNEKLSGVEVIHDPDQYSNDLEKALSLAREKGGDNVKVLGATGFRLDHTLKNLSVLKQFHDKFNQIIFLDNFVTIKLLSKHFSEPITAGTSVSLFPLSGKVTGVTSEGLKYELNNDTLENGVFDGSSNTVASSPINIQHKEGDLLLFISHKEQMTNYK